MMGLDGALVTSPLIGTRQTGAPVGHDDMFQKEGCRSTTISRGASTRVNERTRNYERPFASLRRQQALAPHRTHSAPGTTPDRARAIPLPRPFAGTPAAIRKNESYVV